MFNLYLKYQIRKKFYIYSFMVFSVGILFSFSSEKILLLSILIPSFFYKKFIYPVKSSEIDARLIILSSISPKLIIRLQNVAFFIWFFLGYIISYLFYTFTKSERTFSIFDLTLFIPVAIFSFLIGNLYHIYFNKTLSHNILSTWGIIVFYFFLVTTFFLLLLSLKYFEDELYMLPITVILFLCWVFQTKQPKP